MHYDPIKLRLSRLLGRSRLLRRLFFLGLNTLFLRSWYVRRELKRIVDCRLKIEDLKRVSPCPANPQSAICNLQFLDAGMGFGQYSDWMLRSFRGAQLVGLEIDRAHFYGGEDYFRRVHPASRLIVGDVQGLPLADRKLDLVLTVDVMEHVADDRAAFAEFQRVLKPGGFLVMHTPRVRDGKAAPPLSPPGNRGGESEGWRVGEHIRDGYKDEEAQHRLEEAGFEVVRLVRGYGAAGRFAWMLLQKIPMSLMTKGRALLLPAALFIIIGLPLALAAMWLDFARGDHNDGGSLLMVARRPAEA